MEDYNAVFLPWGKRWNGANVASQLVDKCVPASPRKLCLFSCPLLARAFTLEPREGRARPRSARAAEMGTAQRRDDGLNTRRHTLGSRTFKEENRT